ncbi:hypothetical protein PA171_04334 [Pseudomonas aeruginosa]|nr:hypothetical protein PA171_04334 [Pseudomonas aeruginosa]VTQ43194.1 Uncharacterised protein [Pseudomonas aeruginosa]
MDTPPCWLMPRKRCGLETDCRALIATVRLPSVPFLKPTAEDRPEAISRWVCDSVVRAPIADQLIRSCRYCGEIGSSASVAVGKPFSARSRSSWRPMCRPSWILNESSRYGSLIRPFQPTVVRGFSKYTRITRNSVSATSAASALRRSAYSWAALMSWMEQGPITTNRRWSLPSRMSRTTWRPWATVCRALSVRGISRLSCSGVIRVSLEATLRSSICKSAIVVLNQVTGAGRREAPCERAQA